MTVDVAVPERGSTRVDARTWQLLAADETFWALVDRKIVNSSARRDGSWSISAGNSVGLAKCGEVTLRIRGKVPGALQALLTRQLSGVRTLPLPGAFTREDALVEDIVIAFAAAVRQYVTRGRDWAYRRVRQRGSVIGGRLLVRETLALRAQGRPQLAVYDKRHITHVTPVNECIAAALRVTEDLYLSGLLGEPAIAGARALAPFFHDNNTVDVLFGAPSAHARRASDLAEGSDTEARDMLHLAAVLLSGAGMDPLGDAAGHLPITWFVNLEEAFEAAVRDGFDLRLRPSWLVEKGGDTAYLFPEVSHLDVTPDLVLTRSDSGDRVVGDVKYKNLDGLPAASDLYQLLAHTTSLGSRTGFLVYPSDGFRQSRLGVSTTGVSVDVFTVDVRDLDAQVDQIVTALAIDDTPRAGHSGRMAERRSWASSPAVRRGMQSNRSRDTGPELAVRRLVHAAGLRYRVDVRPLPDVNRRADLVFTPARVAVFIDGCFWHGCPEHHTMAKSNADYWAEKVRRNRERDADTDARLADAGWTTVRVWEHEAPAAVAELIAKTVRRRST